MFNDEDPCYGCVHDVGYNDEPTCPGDCPVLETMISHCAEHGDFEGTTCQGCVNPTIH